MQEATGRTTYSGGESWIIGAAAPGASPESRRSPLWSSPTDSPPSMAASDAIRHRLALGSAMSDRLTKITTALVVVAMTAVAIARDLSVDRREVNYIIDQAQT